jgi:hypothetical protein
MPTQETIGKRIIGKRIVAVVWVPVRDVDGIFALGSITLEGGLILSFKDGYVYTRLKEADHADGIEDGVE